jgi:hypothetical protein
MTQARWTRKYNIKRLTPEQNKWLQRYEGCTGIEPMHLDELRDGTMTFNEAAKENIDWFEMHMHDAFHAISYDIPYSPE